MSAETQRMLGRIALKSAFFSSPYASSRKQKSFRVEYLSTGVPTIKNANCHASIAHTREWGVGAVANHPIGVDIECIRKRPYEKELLRYIASPAEQKRAKSHSAPRAHLLTVLWVIKESARKCLGVSRPVDPKKLVIRQKMGNTFLVRVRQRKRYKDYHVKIIEFKNILVGYSYPARPYARIHIF